MSTTPRSSPGSKRPLWIALAAAVTLFALSLPWQMRQWQENARLRQQTQAQQAQISALQNAQEATPSPNSPLQNAEQLLQTGRTKDAEHVLTDAEQRLRDDAPSEAALRLSDLFQKVGRIDRAYHWARVAQQKSPDGLEELLRLGTLELILGHADAARSAFLDAQKKHKDNASALISFALYLNQTEDGSRASDYLRRAISLQPENWQARILLVQQLVGQAKFDDARREIEPVLTEPAAQDSVWTQLADLYIQQARKQPASQSVSLARATEALDTAEKNATPNTPGIPFRRGTIKLMQGDVQGARKIWEPLLATTPTYPGLKFALGRVLIQTGDKARGTELLQEQAQSKAAEDEYARLVLAAGAAPPSAASHRALARWCQSHARLPRARLEWELVQQLAPSDQEASQALANLNP